MIRFLLLVSGYVEEARIAPLTFEYQGEKQFDTLNEALTDLAHALLGKYKEEGHYEVWDGFVADEFAGWIHSLHEATCNSWGAVDAGDWWPWASIADYGKCLDEVVEIRENAERYLILALDPLRLDPQEQAQLKNYFEEHTLLSLADLAEDSGSCVYGKDVVSGK